jgi:hypothetical protein
LGYFEQCLQINRQFSPAQRVIEAVERLIN